METFSIGHKLDFITKGLKVEGSISYDAKEGRWIRRVLETRPRWLCELW